ncbi:MAG: (d)CMP kinase [Syntrophomonadaceae bacterium]|nr:(d)CMP kinase [Syntrophomonadaceae bacterium]
MKIAIDGPAGAGKSTVARRVAKELGILYIDTGAMYRALTWKALQQKIDLSAPQELHQLAADTVIDIQDDGEGTRIYCDGREVTNEIRSPEVSRMVSVIAADDKVREIMVEKQRAIASRNDVVMDGRDITHCVLPDAEYKFYLTASLDVRTRRRGQELKNQGYEVDLEQLKREIMERDQLDMNRKVGPLMITPDAMVIDTSDIDCESAVRRVLDIVREG